MSTNLPGFAAAVALPLGLWGCDSATAQESEAEQVPLDLASLAAAADGAASAAFQAPREADCEASSPETRPEQVDESAAELVTACRIRVDDPHKSMHFPGTVNVVASVECNRAVPAINMTISLVRDDQEHTSSTAINARSSSLRGNASASCVSGTYQGRAAAIVTHPPGSWPASGTLNKTSSLVYIDCD